jgi:hypothetical protein
MRGLFGWFVEQVREVNRANDVMRVPELRARYTGPASAGRVRRRARTGGGGRLRGGFGRRCVQLRRGSAR